MNNLINKINLCNHIGTLCTDGALMLREVRFYNSSEQTGTAHHFYSLCSSSICTGKISLFRILEYSFETRNWTCEFYQGKSLFVFSEFLLKMNWFIFNVKQCFIPSSNLAPVTFLNFGVSWVKSSLRCRSAHLKLLYLFRILICVRQGSP